MTDDVRAYRHFLKDTIRKKIDFRETDQNKGMPPPPWQKPVDPEARRVKLPPKMQWERVLGGVDLLTAMVNRESRRSFSADPLRLDELAFLLWVTQGVKARRGDLAVLRTVPSAGARHSFETYIFAMNVVGLDKGLYRYLGESEELVLLAEIEDMEEKLSEAALGQTFVGQAAVTFVWATLPYRMEWRYSLAAHRAILIDAGHVCQNLYLGCEAAGAAMCAVSAYDQEALDEMLGLDGENEFAIYLAPVGKRREG